MKRLTRSSRDRVFGGVCGGLAEYLELDAVLVRVGFVALGLLSGVFGGILLYLFAWLIIPLNGEESAPAHTVETSLPTRQRPTRLVIGLLLAVAGILALGLSFLPPFWSISDWRVAGPVVLIVVGIAVMLWRHNTASESASAMNMSGAPDSGQPPVSAFVDGTAPKTRSLTRLHHGRKIAGVCAGLGNYFDVDPTIIRVIFLALLFAGGAGLLIYLIMWISMPLED